MCFRLLSRLGTSIMMMFFGVFVFAIPASAFSIKPASNTPDMVIAIPPDDPTPTPTTAPIATPTPTTATSGTTKSTSTPTKKKSSNSSSTSTSTTTTGLTPTPTSSTSGITLEVTSREIVSGGQNQPFEEVETVDITMNDSLSFVGTTSPANLKINLNCQNFQQSVTSSAQGAWQYLLVPKDSNLQLGSYACTAYAEDSAGNKSETVTLANFNLKSSISATTPLPQKSIFSSIYFWLILLLLLLLILLLLWWLRRRKKDKDREGQNTHSEAPRPKLRRL